MLRQTKNHIPIGLLASGMVALLLVPVFLYLDIKISAAVPLAVLTGLTSQHFLRLMLGPNGSDVFLPTTLVAAYFVIYFGLRSYFLWTAPFFPRLGRNLYDDYLSAALWCACTGYFSFYLGMGSRLAMRWLRKVPVVARQLGTVPLFRVVLLMLIGVACQIYLFKIGLAVGNYGNLQFQRQPPPGIIVLLATLVDLGWVAICVLLIMPGKRPAGKGQMWFLFGISIGILGVKLAISGGKVALIQPLLEAAIVFHYGKRRFRIWEMAAIGIPLVMAAFGVVNFYRFVVIGQHGSPKDSAAVLSRILSASDLLTSEQGTGHSSALEQMVERNAGTDALALIIKYTPHPFPYIYGYHWLEIPLTFVPRQLWRGKPIDMPSAEFESTYMGEPRNYNGFSSMHLIGDLYRNFAWVGVVTGMFFFGVLLRLFYGFCSPAPRNPVGLFLYAALFPEIIHSLEADAGYAVIIVARAALLALAVAAFLGARFRTNTDGKFPATHRNAVWSAYPLRAGARQLRNVEMN
jgi:hypothetical protein